MGLYTGNDNIGGSFNEQEVTQYSFTGNSCTAPDGSTGLAFVLVHGNEVITYDPEDQLYLDAPGSNDTVCAGGSGVTFATETFSVVAGTGKLAKASGSITQTYVCPTIGYQQNVQPQNAALFGACQVTETGSVKY